MPAVDHLTALFAQAQDVNVRILDDGRGGIGLRDLIVPLGTLLAALIGGLGGVLIGAKMNRRTLKTLEDERHAREDERENDRAEREDRLDQARAERERVLELDRERRAINAEKRRTVGALRIALNGFDDRLTELRVCVRTHGRWPPGGELRLKLRPEDEHLMATWMWLPTWNVFSTVLSMLRDADRARGLLHDAEAVDRVRRLLGDAEAADDASDADDHLEWERRHVRRLAETLRRAIGAGREEVARLTADIGEDSEPSWAPIPDLDDEDEPELQSSA